MDPFSFLYQLRILIYSSLKIFSSVLCSLFYLVTKQDYNLG